MKKEPLFSVVAERTTSFRIGDSNIYAIWRKGNVYLLPGGDAEYVVAIGLGSYFKANYGMGWIASMVARYKGERG